MPSGPKKRRAAKRRNENAVNFKDNNATDLEEITGITRHAVVEGDNSLVIETVTVIDLAETVDTISKGTGHIDNEAAREDVKLGSKEKEGEVLPSVDDKTLDSQIVSELKESEEALLSKDEVCMDNISAQAAFKEIKEPVFPEDPIYSFVVQDALKDHEEAVLYEEVIHEDFKAAEDVLQENEVVISSNVVVYHDSLIAKDDDKFVSKDIEDNLLLTFNENISNSSFVKASSSKEEEEKNLRPLLDDDAGASSIVIGFVPEENEDNILLDDDTGASSIVIGCVSKENEDNILQTALKVDKSNSTEYVLDSARTDCLDSITSSTQIHYACPLHCKSDCSLHRWVGAFHGVSSCEDGNVGDNGKTLKSVEVLERVKKAVEAELSVTDEVGLLLRKLLDDLNAIQLTQGQ
ncbi:unnamed protein product [Ilex paraguariensis]|uniref:Uncharacterized protein n=1 Tax=Ilex paraguariensis TaxID=185542 RepID=A0ABC8RUH7_9AQUA